VSTGLCRGEIEVTNEELEKNEWAKYRTDGTSDGEKRKTSAEDIFRRLGIKSRPIASSKQTLTSMFNDAFDDALQQAGRQGVTDVEGNVLALWAGTTTEPRTIPNFLDEVCDHAGLHPNHQRELISQACAGFNHGINRLSVYAEENPRFEGYAAIGAAEIIPDMWAKNNFDRVLFGDVSGVAIFKVTPRPNLRLEERGVVGCVNSHTLDTKGEIEIIRLDGTLYMDGKKVMQHAPRAMIETFKKSVALAGLGVRDINQLIFHSGSKHMHSKMESSMVRIYGDDFDATVQLPTYIEDSGNNGASSTVNTLHRQLRGGKISRRDVVYLGAIGMGYYEAGLILRNFLLEN